MWALRLLQVPVLAVSGDGKKGSQKADPAPGWISRGKARGREAITVGRVRGFRERQCKGSFY